MSNTTTHDDEAPSLSPVPSQIGSYSSSSSCTLVNEVPKPDVDKPPETDSDKPKETRKVLVDTPGYRKEVRTSKSNRTYVIETHGLWTTLRSLTPHMRKKSMRERVLKRLQEFQSYMPFLWRFAKEVIRLGRWRFLIHLIGSTVTGLVPALRIYLSSRLISIAQTASDKRILRKGELLVIATASYLSGFIEQWIDGLLANNNGILQRRFESMVNEHLMQARARLDIHTLGKQRIMRDFQKAHGLVHALGDGTFAMSQLIDLFTSAVSLTTQASMLWSMTTHENVDLAMMSVFSSSLMLLRWFWRRHHYSMQAITDQNYNRMSLMEYMSHPESSTFGERKVLGVGDWVLNEYKKASRALGDVSLSAPASLDPFATATEAIKTFSDTALYVLFALKVSEKPIGEATISMSSLTFIQGAARGLAGSLYRFVRDVQNFGSEFSAFQAYYRVLDVKTAIEEPTEPTPYATSRRTLENGEERAGMDIEFKNVSFTWPGKKEKALDDISFKINAGELCAIVGYNGAGKSTLIALMSRLCDPSSGQILINGHDIRTYKTSDLYKAMSLLFQNSAELPLTLREFIGIGNIDKIDDMDAIRKAATESGAIEFIDKIENGFESSFTGQVEMETADTLYRDAVEWDESSDDEDNEEKGDSDSDSDSEDDEKADKDESKKAEDDKKSEEACKDGSDSDEKQKGDEASNDTEDKSNSEFPEERSGRLAFSGGQRQKLQMSRNFMRTADLAIFDEYSASLDPIAEHELFKKITALRGQQTILYITHRYSTVRHADRILMLEKGKVIESGTHEELIAIPGGKYAEMSKLALGETDDIRAKDTPQEDDEKSSQAGDADTSSELGDIAASVALPPSRPSSPTI